MEGGEAGGAHDLRNVSLVGLGFCFCFVASFFGAEAGRGGGRICSTSSTAFEDEWLLPLYEILARKPG